MSNLVRQHIKHPITNITLFARICDKKQIQLVTVMLGTYKKYKETETKLSNNMALRKYTSLIKDYLNGKIYSLGKIKFSFKGYTDFQKKVLKAARSIPRGRTVSYKKLAQMSGYPKAVRAVANVMRHNPFPLVIPCHRVIRSDGSIGGFGGKVSGSNIKLKRKLLEREGVTL